MEKKNVKVAENKVAEKKVAFDYKALAESIEKAFKTDKTVDVIADTNLEKGPQNTTEPEYRYIHFYRPGTQKNMFGLYIKPKNEARFAVANKLAAYLDKSLNVVPFVKKIAGEEKTAYLIVTCEYDQIADTAKKIVAAYQSIPAKAEKPKKAEKSEPKQKAEKKPAAKKNNVAKRPAKKAVATA